MGQPVTVHRKPTSRKGVIRFEVNRTLTGMGHERYASPADAAGDRPADEVARRCFERAGVVAVHVYSNEILVEVGDEAEADAIAADIERLFIHYREGVTPSYP